MLIEFFSSFTGQDFAIIGLLIFLEGILSIDNALVLAILARKVPQHLQKRALLYGLVGAVFFRFFAISVASYLIHLRWIKFVGGGYLLFLSGKHFLTLGKSKEEEGDGKPKAESFWKMVVLIELTDIAFALDSILAAVALTNKVSLVITGGVIGLLMMRFAATVFLKLLDRFPSFEHTAYLLVAVIGTKVVIEGFEFEGINFHDLSHPAFWVFWSLMAVCICFGFYRPKSKS